MTADVRYAIPIVPLKHPTNSVDECRMRLPTEEVADARGIKHHRWHVIGPRRHELYFEIRFKPKVGADRVIDLTDGVAFPTRHVKWPGC